MPGDARNDSTTLAHGSVSSGTGSDTMNLGTLGAAGKRQEHQEFASIHDNSNYETDRSIG